jgi:hypothetical protein
LAVQERKNKYFRGKKIPGGFSKKENESWPTTKNTQQGSQYSQGRCRAFSEKCLRKIFRHSAMAHYPPPLLRKNPSGNSERKRENRIKGEKRSREKREEKEVNCNRHFRKVFLKKILA